MTEGYTMPTYNIHAAKTHFSRLVDEMEKGEEVIIARAGKPVGKFVSFNPEKPATKSRIGFMKGMYTIPDNFEELEIEADKEILKLFFGEDTE